ncbi:MAG: phosphodiester glycosidase family protein [Flavobacteriales bacterium]
MFAILFLMTCAAVVWRLIIASSAVDAVPAVQIEQITWQQTKVTVVRVDLRESDFRLFWRDPQQQLYRRFEALRADLAKHDLSLRFAMNAGMYHADRAPVGMLMQEGQLKAPLNTANGTGNFFLQPNGVFAVTQAGQAVIEPTSNFAQRELSTIRWATQSGPMLLSNGNINPLFNPESNSRYIRNAVGRVDENRLVFVISEQPISFYGLASVLKNQLDCKDALYLDGTISGLYDAKRAQNPQPEDYGVILGVVKSTPNY